jgi:hypothetical protein
MTDELTPLTASNHWLGWLGDDPAKALRESLEHCLQCQVPTARLEWLRLLKEPHFLTGGRKSEDDPGQLVVTRAALAVAFELEVKSEQGTEQLSGVFSWVASDMDGERRDRVYLDLGMDLGTASNELQARIYGLAD